MRPAACLEHNGGPNRNGSRKDHVMAAKPLPPQEVLRQLLRYEPETGKLFWKERTAAQMNCIDDRGPTWAANQWNSKNSGKEAFTASDRRGYMHGKVRGTKYQAHRVIWKLVYGEDPEFIDHINGVQGDNRLSNLRNCTNEENSRNYAKKIAGSSQYRGVCWVKRDHAWAARISAGNLGKINIGYFPNEIDAARAYDQKAMELHGEFATLNFPMEA